MFNLTNNGIITITRGDYFSIPLFINAGSEMKPMRYKLSDLDEVYFGVMESNQLFENAIIRKKFTSEDMNKNGDIVIEIQSKDTMCLLPGKYFYQVKLNKFNSDKNEYEVNTLIPKTQFFIEE